MICNLEIKPGEEMAKLGEGQCFHPSCFKCHTCKKEISGSYVKDKQGFLCANCIPT